MLPQTRTSRTLFSGAALFLLTVSLTAGLRLCAKPYSPQAPDYRTEGPSDAPVLLAEFSDFQCGGCRAAAEPLRQLKGLFPGRIRFLFKHTPWDFHPNARAAAIAAECAGRGGKFWVYHDMLFSRQQEWGEAKTTAESFTRYAKEAGVGVAVFASCLQDPSAAAAVDADIQEAKDVWVRATPTFFINGRRLVGVRQLRSTGFNLIERKLKKP